jgi:hypothetical protein
VGVTKTLEFLKRVWTDRRSWVDIPSKINGHWIPWSIEWPDADLAAIRITTAVADDEDVYFSPAQYKNRGRRYEDVLPTYWLWADLDRVTPEACAEAGFTPTLAWASSPQRYQALWELDHACSPAGIERLNRQMTYTLGADKSGWDLTQVLRVPGTRNYKYPGGPEVQVCLVTDEIYHPRALLNKLRAAGRFDPPSIASPLRASDRGERPGAVAVVPVQAKVLLGARDDQVVEGERSHQIWKLECLLAEAGFDQEGIYELVSESAWNKWKDVNTGESRLRREIDKAIRHVGDNGRGRREVGGVSAQVLDGEVVEHGLSDQRNGRDNRLAEAAVSEAEVLPEEVSSPSPFVAYGDFLSAHLEAPRWLIEELWTAKSHGMIGGEPKAMKSMLSLALGMSVASGRPFLMDRKYRVGTKGPVLIIQEENDPWRMQDLMRKMAAFYGLLRKWDVQEEEAERGVQAKHISHISFPRELPLKLLNNYGFDMLNEEHRELLEEEIRDMSPALVVLDPFYLMCGGADLNRSDQVAPFFKWLIHLKFTYGTAIIVNHHFRKQTANGPQVRSGQRTLGSTTFHAWVASALYSQNTTTEEDGKNVAKVKLEREFRNVGPLRSLDIRLNIGDPGTLDFSADILKFDAVRELVRLVQADPGITVNAASETLGADKRTVLSRARGSEKIRLEGGKRGRGHSWKLFPAEDADGDA